MWVRTSTDYQNLLVPDFFLGSLGWFCMRGHIGDSWRCQWRWGSRGTAAIWQEECMHNLHIYVYVYIWFITGNILTYIIGWKKTVSPGLDKHFWCLFLLFYRRIQIVAPLAPPPPSSSSSSSPSNGYYVQNQVQIVWIEWLSINPLSISSLGLSEAICNHLPNSQDIWIRNVPKKYEVIARADCFLAWSKSIPYI